MQSILLVEDNSSIVMGLEYLLKEEGYEFYTASTRAEADKLLGQKQFDLVLLDVTLPDGNGYQLCRQIKEQNLAPVIFLTARDQESDVVMGFDLGADDYVMKPFRNRELVSRIKNVLRRNGKEQQLICQNIRMDLDAGAVYRKVSNSQSDGTTKQEMTEEVISLTKLEYKILQILMSNPKKLFTREEILANIWDASGNFVNDNTLTVTIKRLREKIGDKEGKIIVTVRGMGYRLGGNE